jgi:hypothetical protein
MKPEYLVWIQANVTDVLPNNGYGKCDSVTKAMIAAFPELRRACGFYYCPSWGKRTHWWCVSLNGSIVDPTALQFPSRGLGEYDELIQGEDFDKRVPVGKCPNCGDVIYGIANRGKGVCSDKCAEEYAAYLMNPN